MAPPPCLQTAPPSALWYKSTLCHLLVEEERRGDAVRCTDTDWWISSLWRLYSETSECCHFFIFFYFYFFTNAERTFCTEERGKKTLLLNWESCTFPACVDGAELLKHLSWSWCKYPPQVCAGPLCYTFVLQTRTRLKKTLTTDMMMMMPAFVFLRVLGCVLAVAVPSSLQTSDTVPSSSVYKPLSEASVLEPPFMIFSTGCFVVRRWPCKKKKRGLTLALEVVVVQMNPLLFFLFLLLLFGWLDESWCDRLKSRAALKTLVMMISRTCFIYSQSLMSFDAEVLDVVASSAVVYPRGAVHPRQLHPSLTRTQFKLWKLGWNNRVSTSQVPCLSFL